MSQVLLEKIKEFPDGPGVYLMKDKTQRVIYVGKAKNLKSRVRQYFSGHDLRAQVVFLMARVIDIDFLSTQNETEALLLENSLIKKHKPKYNVFLKDDKTYQGLKITVQDDFPRLLTTRKIKKDGSVYYGPFTSSDSLYRVKEFIDRFFQLRTCPDFDFKTRTRPCLEYQIKRCSAPCVGKVSKEEYAKQIEAVRLFLDGKSRELQKSLHRKMQESASKENFEEAARLRDLLSSMEMVLETQNVERISFDFVDILAMDRQEQRIRLVVLMVREAKLIDSHYYTFDTLEDDEEFLQNFVTQYYSENAFIPKEVLLPIDLKNDTLLPDLLTERAGFKVKVHKPLRGEKCRLLDLAVKNLETHAALQEKKNQDLATTLENLQGLLCLSASPERVECYDISNISGKDAVGSMITFVSGKKYSEGYRRFKIRGKDTPDDYAMMHEVLSRRFSRDLNSEGWKKPDLIVMDGGKGQLSQALKVLSELNVTGVDVVAIAKGHGDGARAKGLWADKKEEEIYLPNRKNPVILRRGSAELLLLQQIRDESHRFAITFHRQLRDKKISASALDKIPGIGEKRKTALLNKFGSYDKIRLASEADLISVTGMSIDLVKKIKEQQ